MAIQRREEKVAGELQVGFNDSGDVIINGGRAAIDSAGDWHIVFSQKQARKLANTIYGTVDKARAHCPQEVRKAVQ